MGRPVTTTTDDDPTTWEIDENEKGFELSHGCAVLFDLFHNCSCKILLSLHYSIIFNMFCSRKRPL